MSDNLKDFIAKNEAHFDAVPKSGHFDRFKQLQEKQSAKASTTGTGKWMLYKIAAVFILVIGVSWLFFNLGKMQGSAGDSAHISTSTSFDEELNEAEIFFTEKVNLKRQEVLAYSGANDPATAKIMTELDKLEIQYLNLKEELTINENNPQIINAMVENYRMRLSLLERLLNQLKKSNTIKQKHHDEVQA